MEILKRQQKIEISLSCRSLLNQDITSKSNPFILFYLKDKTNNNSFTLKGETEIIKDNLNPNFVTTFIVDYIFEVKQECRFEVWYYESEQKSDILGSVTTSIGEIVGSKGQVLVLNLLDYNQKKLESKIILLIRKVAQSNEKYLMKFKSENLSNPSVWLNLVSGKCPFFIVYKSNDDGSWLKVYESVVQMDIKNPQWKAFEIQSSRINENNHLRLFKVEVWNWKKSGIHKFFGECLITIDNLLQNIRIFELKNPNNAKKKKIGMLICEEFSISVIPDFFDYLQSGLQMNLILAIDFTLSNGVPQNSGSLHAKILPDNKLNQYQEAIQKIGGVILDYDNDKVVNVFGFGAKPHFPNLFEPTVSHCFPLSGDPNQTEVNGLKGIFEIYDHAMNYIEFSSPTLIHPMIEKAKTIALDCKTRQKDIYNILLILTDGEVSEFDATITSLVEVFKLKLPLSVIIVGIGASDFGDLTNLEIDQGLIKLNGVKSESEFFAQFVPFRQFEGCGEALAEKVLKEVPDQVVKYMLSIGKKPGQAINIDVEKVINRLKTERQSILNISLHSQELNKNRTIPDRINEEDEEKRKEEFVMPKAEHFNKEEEKS